MPRNPEGAQNEPQDDSSPEEELDYDTEYYVDEPPTEGTPTLDVNLENINTRGEPDIEFKPFSKQENEDSGTQEKINQTEEELDIELNKKASKEEFKLDHPELNTSKNIPEDYDLGKSFWGAPISTLKGIWHRTLAPHAWQKRTSENKYASWAKKYDAFKKSRKETVEERGWAEDVVGAKWYSMPAGVTNLTSSVRGLWYLLTSPNYIIKNDLLPNEHTSLKELAENVEWRKTRDKNPAVKTSLEKIGKKSIEEYKERHQEGLKGTKEYDNVERVERLEKQNTKHNEKVQNITDDILDKIKIVLEKANYENAYEERSNSYNLPNKLMRHAADRLLVASQKTKLVGFSEKREMLNTIVSTLSNKILEKEKIKKSELLSKGIESAEFKTGMKKNEDGSETEVYYMYINGVNTKININSGRYKEEFGNALIKSRNARISEKNYTTRKLLAALEAKGYKIPANERREEIENKLKDSSQKFINQELHKIVRPETIASIQDLNNLAGKIKELRFGQEYNKDTSKTNNEFVTKLNTLKKQSTNAELEMLDYNNPESPIRQALDRIQQRRKSA